MSANLIPLFETHERFLHLDPNNLSKEQPVVVNYLESFPEDLDAINAYAAVKGFLRNYSGNETTYNTYRTYIERPLLWSLLILKKSLLTLTRQDFERFMEFNLTPPDDWIGPRVKCRFRRVGGRTAMPTDICVVNPEWRPFNATIRKCDRKRAEELHLTPIIAPYKMKEDSINLTFSVSGSFFEWMFVEGIVTIPNPVHSIKIKSKYKQKSVATKADLLTPRQWDFVLETAKILADQDPETHERTLFIVATMYSLYLRVSDIVGRDDRKPMMCDFREDPQGNWWFYVTGNGGIVNRISVKDEYMRVWMPRYRRSLGLTPVPFVDDKTPLLQSLKGRAGLSGRHISLLVQQVFDRALERMREGGFSDDEINNLRSASLHWLRDTSARVDAQVRDHKDLQADLRHHDLSSTLDRYYYRDDDDRHSSNKKIRIEADKLRG